MTTATCFERETRTLTTLYLFEEAVITYTCSKKTSFLKISLYFKANDSRVFSQKEGKRWWSHFLPREIILRRGSFCLKLGNADVS